MNAVEVKQYVRGLKDLSTLPVLLGKIIAVINDDDAATDDLVKLISFDQAMAQRILRVANSVLFGHSGQIRDIHQAVLFLGSSRIKTVALGMSLLDVFPVHGSFNVQNLWIHSYEVAYLSSLVSDGTSITQPQECFLAGLLHDIGRIIFYTMAPERFLKIETTDTMLEQENEIFGCTHAEAGGWFGESIGLPQELISTIKYHHHPSIVQEGREIVSLVSLAEALSRQFSPRIEDDGLWTREHDALLLELSLTEKDIHSFSEKFSQIRPEIDSVFSESEKKPEQPQNDDPGS
jgi:putative nucleotidyltransferase with HDIG domain